MQHLRIATLLLCGIVALAGVDTAWADVVYSFTTIDVPGASSTSAYGINDSSQIVGDYYDSTGMSHGLVDTGGSFTTIDVPGGSYSHAYGINDSGQIVGWYADHGFLDNGGSFTEIDVPGAILTEADGISESGQIVGYSSLGSLWILAAASPSSIAATRSRSAANSPSFSRHTAELTHCRRYVCMTLFFLQNF
jgi:uncharacterized membrane protein